MTSTIYSGDILSAVDDHIRLGLDAICKSCPARQSPDMIDLCMDCVLTTSGIGQDSAHHQQPQPMDTRDYFS